MNLILEKEKHQYFRDGIEIPSVSEILEVGGFVDYSMVSDEILTASGNFGDVLHETCKLHDLGKLQSCDPRIEPYLNGWIKFVKDYDVQFYLVEESLDSKVWGYAGTPDRVGRVRNKDKGVDIKSGVIQEHHELQISGGYEILIEENLKIKIKESWTVQPIPNDYKIIPHKDITSRAVFIGALQCYHWKKRKGKLK